MKLEKTMDDNTFNSPENIPTQNAIPMDGIPSHTSLNMPLMDQNYSMLQRDSNAIFAPLPSWNMSNKDVNMQMGTGSDVFNSFLMTNNIFLASRSDDVRENLDNLPNMAPSVYPLNQFREPYSYHGSSSNLNPSLVTIADCRYNDGFGGRDSDKWGFESRTGFQAYSCIGALGTNLRMSSIDESSGSDFPFGISKFSNELSLSLATSNPGIISCHVSDQCSEISRCAAPATATATATRLASEQASCSSKDLSLSFPSNGPTGNFSQLILGSKYLQAVQEILTQIASYSLESSSEGPLGYSAGKPASGAYYSGFSPCFWNAAELVDVDCSKLEAGSGSGSHRRASEAKKAPLLNLLQVVDDRYSQCLDELHTVVSAFHAATELDPVLHTRFALQTVSFLYKNLRERISSQILVMGSLYESDSCVRGKEKAQEINDSFVQRQWALQQLRRKNHQLWRPQRGLPETSVSVLRAWMFQNFLHPYPKDSEKHLLAIKSGLTRSQVSNWFINARVRLWKPMIEEMYMEMNRRKAHRDDDGGEGSHRRR